MATIEVKEDRVAKAHSGDILVQKGLTSCMSITLIMNYFEYVIGGHIVAVNSSDTRPAQQRVAKVIGQMMYKRHVPFNNHRITGIVLAGVLWTETSWMSLVDPILRIVRNDYPNITWFIDLSNVSVTGNDVKFDVNNKKVEVVNHGSVLFSATFPDYISKPKFVATKSGVSKNSSDLVDFEY